MPGIGGNYHPNQIASLYSEIDCVEAEFLDHSNPSVLFFTEWENLLGKYFKKMPAQFTFNYFFEFNNGSVTVRHLTDTPDSEAFTVGLVKGDPSIIRNALLTELFGCTAPEHMKLANVKLPRYPGNHLKPQKLILSRRNTSPVRPNFWTITQA